MRKLLNDSNRVAYVALLASILALIVSLSVLTNPATAPIRFGTNLTDLTVTTLTATTATITTDNITTLNVGGQPVEGGVQFGSNASVADASSITHGFSVTPTTCTVSPVWVSGAAVTAVVGSITTTGFSVKTSGTITVNWFCGK